jgi:hypothetical protein
MAGCAQRTLTINSEPSGALVYLNGDEVGRTPLKYDFNFYGDYDVVLRKDGYETLKTHQNLTAPIYMWPPIDLFSEALGVKDKRQWNFAMSPAVAEAVSSDLLLKRADVLKSELRSSKYTRAPATLPAAPATQP